MGARPRYHFQKVDEPPPSIDGRSRPSKLQRILDAARKDGTGTWVLAATYVNHEGAAAAGRRLVTKEQGLGHHIDWEWTARKYVDDDGHMGSRLYLRVRSGGPVD